MSKITRERFIELMDSFATARNASQRIDEIVEHAPAMRSARDFFSATCLYLPSESVACELLMAMFDDKDAIIEYWMCEKQLGEDWSQGDLVEGGRDIDLSDAGKLYDYLIERTEGGN